MKYLIAGLVVTAITTAVMIVLTTDNSIRELPEDVGGANINWVKDFYGEDL